MVERFFVLIRRSVIRFCRERRAIREPVARSRPPIDRSGCVGWTVGGTVCDGRLYAVTHDVPQGLDRVSSCPVLQPPSRWVRDGSGDGGEACVPGGTGVGWSG